MKPLREFFMEAVLESQRFAAKYNFGESGSRARRVGDLLVGSGCTEADASRVFLDTCLRDSPNWGRDDLRDLVAALHPGASRENVLITTGTSEALLLLFQSLRPSKVALAAPAFQLLYELPESLDARLVPLPIRWNERGAPFLIESEWLKLIEAEQPDCLVWNSPQNPSGLRLPSGLLDQIRERMARWNGVVIGDEHYRMLSSETARVGATAYRQDGRTFVTGSFTKCLGCPGLRIGWCVGVHSVLERMQNAKNFTTHTVNPITEWIAYEVLRDMDSAVFEQVHSEWLENRRLLNDFLSQSKTVYGIAPEGGLVTTVGYRNVDSDAGVTRRTTALTDAGIFVLPLSTMEFGKFGGDSAGNPIERGWGFRLGLGEAPSRFAEGLQAIEKTLIGM